MSVPFKSNPTPSGTRKDQAYAFIVEYILRRRTSPSLEEIANHLAVSKSRVRALLAQLVDDGAIDRPIGTQRAIVVPGLMQRIAVELLRAEGWNIDAEMKLARRPHPLPHEHLPLVAVIEHRPDHAEASDA